MNSKFIRFLSMTDSIIIMHWYSMKGIKFKAKPKKNQLDKCLSCRLLNQTYNVRYCLSLYEWQMADNSIIDNVYSAEMPLFFYGVQDKNQTPASSHFAL